MFYKFFFFITHDNTEITQKRSSHEMFFYTFIAALLLLYDVTNRTSFDNIRAWLGEIRDYAHEDVVIMLIGI